MTTGWNIMTRTRNGTVSILKGLTEDEARQARLRLRKPNEFPGEWYTDVHLEWLFRSRGLYGYGDSPSDLIDIQCWGPTGEELEVRPPPPQEWIDKVRAAQDAEANRIKKRLADQDAARRASLTKEPKRGISQWFSDHHR